MPQERAVAMMFLAAAATACLLAPQVRAAPQPRMRTLGLSLNSDIAYARNVRAAPPVRLTQKDFNTKPYIIRKPGVYQLAEDIEFMPTTAPAVRSHASTSWWVRWMRTPSTFLFPTPAEIKELPSLVLGYFAAIIVCADDVVIDLNGFTLSQSRAHALVQRFYSHIELGSSPFPTGKGPADFGKLWHASRVEIIGPGTLGRTSHHAIHGNHNEDITVSNLKITNFEVSGVHLNTATNLVVEKTAIHGSRRDVAVNGRFSGAINLVRFMRQQFAAHGYAAPLYQPQVLRGIAAKVDALEAVVVQTINEVLQGRPVSTIFKSTSDGIPDGSLVAAIVAHPDLNVGDYWAAGTDAANPLSIHLRSLDIKNLAVKPTEVLTLKRRDTPLKPYGSSGKAAFHSATPWVRVWQCAVERASATTSSAQQLSKTSLAQRQLKFTGHDSFSRAGSPTATKQKHGEPELEQPTVDPLAHDLFGQVFDVGHVLDRATNRYTGNVFSDLQIALSTYKEQCGVHGYTELGLGECADARGKRVNHCYDHTKRVANYHECLAICDGMPTCYAVEWGRGKHYNCAVYPEGGKAEGAPKDFTCYLGGSSGPVKQAELYGYTSETHRGICYAKGRTKSAFKCAEEDRLARHNIGADVLRWAGAATDADAAAAWHRIRLNNELGTGGDFMNHVNKGAIAVKVDGMRDSDFRGLAIDGVENHAPLSARVREPCATTTDCSSACETCDTKRNECVPTNDAGYLGQDAHSITIASTDGLVGQLYTASTGIHASAAKARAHTGHSLMGAGLSSDVRVANPGTSLVAPSPQYPGLLAFGTRTLYATGSFGSFKLKPDAFNSAYQKEVARFPKGQRAGIILRECQDCPASHRRIYYRRKTSPESFEPYRYMMDVWASRGNLRSRDFDLYSTLDDALRGTNTGAWAFCNYDDFANRIGFPRDCGKDGPVGWVWNSFKHSGTRRNYRFSVVTFP